MAGPAAPPERREPGRRERKKLATRAAIQQAALRLALRHGVDDVTVEQIADEADVALRTFFNHFSGKEEAVVALAAAGAEALVVEFRGRPATESVLGALREAVLVVMDRDDAVSRDHLRALRLIRDTPSLTHQQMVVLTAQEAALAAAVAERLGTGVAHDPAPSALHPQLCAAATLAVFRVVLHRWLGPADGPDDPPPLDVLRDEVDRALALLAAGLDRAGAPRP